MVPAGETVRLTNILGTLLPAANAGLGIRVCRGEVFVNSRFYNTGSAEGSVYGMYVPSMAPAEAVTPCRPGVFHHLSYSTNVSVGQRINIGATNATAIDTTWVIKLFDDSGARWRRRPAPWRPTSTGSTPTSTRCSVLRPSPAVGRRSR